MKRYTSNQLLKLSLSDFESIFLNKQVIATISPQYELIDRIIGFSLDANTGTQVVGIRFQNRDREVNLFSIISIGVMNG